MRGMESSAAYTVRYSLESTVSLSLTPPAHVETQAQKAGGLRTSPSRRGDAGTLAGLLRGSTDSSLGCCSKHMKSLGILDSSQEPMGGSLCGSRASWVFHSERLPGGTHLGGAWNPRCRRQASSSAPSPHEDVGGCLHPAQAVARATQAARDAWRAPPTIILIGVMGSPSS